MFVIQILYTVAIPCGFIICVEHKLFIHAAKCTGTPFNIFLEKCNVKSEC